MNTWYRNQNDRHGLTHDDDLLYLSQINAEERIEKQEQMNFYYIFFLLHFIYELLISVVARKYPLWHSGLLKKTNAEYFDRLDHQQEGCHGAI
jgi:hypothetical protein